MHWGERVEMVRGMRFENVKPLTLNRFLVRGFRLLGTWVSKSQHCKS